METIQIQVTRELAQQLHSYTNELPRLLELGLRLIKMEKVTQPVTKIETTSLSVQEQTMPVEYDSWDNLDIEKISVDTGMTDFAKNHDYYLYGTPKKS